MSNTSHLFEVANNGDNVSNVTKKSKKKTRKPLLEILSKSRSTFKKQIIRDAQMKKSAIEHTLKLSDKDTNEENLVFLGNFYDVVENRLLDSNRFTKDCANLGLTAFNVAQHVVFDGDKRLNEVLVFGLEKTYGNEVLKMKEPIFTNDELQQGKVLAKGKALATNSEGSQGALEQVA